MLQDLRDVAGLLYPPLLDEAGLGPALREATACRPGSVRIDAPDERFGPDVEAALYFAVLGCLPDAATAAATGTVEIVVRREGDDVVVLVSGVEDCQAVISDGVRLLGGRRGGARRLRRARPLSARPLSARPLSARPLSARPLSARPLSARPLCDHCEDPMRVALAEDGACSARGC